MRKIAVVLTCALAAWAQSPTPSQTKPEEAKPAEVEKSPAPPKPEPPKEKPFADLTKEAKAVPGLFTLYQTEEKVYLEVLPDQLGKLYMLSLTCESGLGERGFYASMMCGQVPVMFVKSAKNIQLLAKNTRFQAQVGTPIRRAVERSFTDSVLGLAKIESLPHPERKSVLIDLGAILLTDFPMMSYELEATFRIPYRFDAKNSSFGVLKGFPRNVEIDAIAHYSTERPPLPPLLPPGAPAPPMPPPPRNLPDIRSMLFHLRYSFSALPEPGFRPRLADDRVGHFFEQLEDFTTDVDYRPTRRHINRWRLEKANPAAPLSPPKQPIVFWLENTIPVKYRDAIRAGVLLWNKAFERIGFQDVIQVRQQPDDAGWDPADVRYNTIRWFISTDAVFAIGPSRADPVTGEIFDADIGFAESTTRFTRREAREEIGPVALSWDDPPFQFIAPWSTAKSRYLCDLGMSAARDAEFAFDLFELRGMEPDSPEADKFVHDFLLSIAAHEVGHTLGLRHNFRASTIHPFETVQDVALTSSQGLTGSVMDYIPTNVAARGAKQGQYYQTTLGPYDYWAIEYAYKPVEASTPGGELPELNKIAARASDPRLAYATDEDAGISSNPFDMDPLANRNDLGADPLKYYAHRVRLAREVWANMEAKLQKPGEGYQVLRRSFTVAFYQYGNALRMASKYVGGVHHYRDHVGDPGNRLPFEPVPAARQREAMALLRNHLFAPRAFQFSPQLLNKLNNERFPDFSNFRSMLARFDVPIHQMVLDLQKSVLDRLHHPIVLSRVLDSEVKAAEPFRLAELFSGLQDSIWGETKGAAGSLSINSYRRSLQREHLRKLIALLLREAAAPEDARTLARHSLAALRAQLQGALDNAALNIPVETRAHLAESVARIDEALKANMQRMAF